jgi:hypothetical protein
VEDVLIRKRLPSAAGMQLFRAASSPAYLTGKLVAGLDLRIADIAGSAPRISFEAASQQPLNVDGDIRRQRVHSGSRSRMSAIVADTVRPRMPRGQ